MAVPGGLIEHLDVHTIPHHQASGWTRLQSWTRLHHTRSSCRDFNASAARGIRTRMRACSAHSRTCACNHAKLPKQPPTHPRTQGLVRCARVSGEIGYLHACPVCEHIPWRAVAGHSVLFAQLDALQGMRTCSATCIARHCAQASWPLCPARSPESPAWLRDSFFAGAGRHHVSAARAWVGGCVVARGHVRPSFMCAHECWCICMHAL